MSKEKSGFKIVKIVLYAFSFFVFFAIVANFGIKFYLDKTLKNKLTSFAKNKYQLEIKELSINYFSKSVVLDEMVIKPIKESKSNSTFGIFKCKRIVIESIFLSTFFINKELHFENLLLNEPQVFLYIDFSESKAIKVSEKSNSLESSNSSKAIKLNSIFIDYFKTNNIEINIYNALNRSIPIFSNSSNSINCVGVKYYLNNRLSKNSFITDTLEITLNNFKYRLSDDSLYTLTSKKIYANFNKSHLVFDSLKLIPNFSKFDFPIKAKYQISRADISTSSVSFKNVNYSLLLNQRKLYISNVELKKCSIDVFRNNNFPLKKVVKSTLQKLVRNIPFVMSIDTIKMNCGVLTFEAKHPNSYGSGKIAINEMNVIILGLKNDTANYGKKESIQVHADGLVLNKGKFIEEYIFPLNNDTNLFYCSGSLSSMPFSYFNSIIKPVKHLTFRTGQVDHVTFSFTATNNYSYGKMKFTYHNLRIDLLNKYNKKGGFVKSIKTIFANNLYLNRSNPSGNRVPRIAKIYFVNNEYRYFINYAMQSILSGIEPSILIN